MCFWKFGKFGKFEAEVSMRGDIDSLKNALGLGTVDDLKLGSAVASNSTTKLCFFVAACIDTACHVSEIQDSIKAITQVTTDWFNLSNAE